ncbi:hypothetical protein NMY22_g13345 [Coprinellus aureogranulatus]|nr:hypothetical protein NMY22_g13345 [Coprinellus aureogranulatus]
MTDCAASTSDVSLARIPSVDEIRKIAEEKWGIRPCLWQCEVVQAILRRDGDVISISGTGSGKTLTFWLPLLFRPDDWIQVIVTPLNLLGQQQVDNLVELGLKGIFICSETANEANWKDIESGLYRVVVISPEQLMKKGGGFEKLARNTAFRSRILSIIFDEGHCISTWSSFRPEYKEVGTLKYTLPLDIPRLVTTATLTDSSLKEIRSTLHLRTDKLKVFQCSNDRPNIHLTVKKIESSLRSFEDLKFVLDGYSSDNPASKPHETFLVFFDDINQSIAAHRELTRDMRPEDRKKIVWFNSDMTEEFKQENIKKLRRGELWGILTTDSFGMGLDLPNITLVVQWRATCSLTLLWQRFGRAARDPTREGTAVFLVEKEYFDDEKEKKALRRAAAELKKSRPKKRRKKNPLAPGEGNNSAMDVVFVHEHPDVESDSELSDSEEDELPQLPPKPQPTASTSTPRPAKRRRTGKTKKREVDDPHLDEFINAKLRRRPCRRPPVSEAFNNNKAASKHRECDPSKADGCSRCRIPLSRLCCDIHNSPEFRRFAVPRVKNPKAPSKTTVLEREMDAIDRTLSDALNTWREEKTIEVYGWGHYNDFGGTLILPTDILRRIVDCAHASVLSSSSDLERETKWVESQRYGADILEIVNRIRPRKQPTPPPAPPPMPSTAPTFSIHQRAPNDPTHDMDAVDKPKRKYSCKKCDGSGHNILGCPTLSEEERRELRAQSKAKSQARAAKSQTKSSHAKENQPAR